MNRDCTVNFIRLSSALLVLALALGVFSCRSNSEQASPDTGMEKQTEQTADQPASDPSSSTPIVNIATSGSGRSFKGREIAVHRFPGTGD